MGNARFWSAPRIDRFGTYVERELGPRVGSLLHRTAYKIRPPRARSRRGIAMTLLLTGGALGVAGAVATRRNATRRRAAEFGAPEPAEHLAPVSGGSDTEHARTS